MEQALTAPPGKENYPASGGSSWHLAPDVLPLVEQIGEGDRVDVHTREGVEDIDHPLLCGTAIGPCMAFRKGLGSRTMPDVPLNRRKNPTWSRTVLRIILICGGCVAILLPAWLPNRPSVPIERGTVELLQAFLLAASATIMLGAAPHAGHFRPVCRVLAMGLIAAFFGEIEDFVSGILGWKFPEAWVVGGILLIALITILRHRRSMIQFLALLGNHAGAGFIGAALLIIYVFNRMIGSPKFWKATLGPDFSPAIPRTCKSYLELLACYLIFIGALGLSITLARRKEPS